MSNQVLFLGYPPSHTQLHDSRAAPLTFSTCILVYPQAVV